jgi:hypothetical protein
LIKNDLSHSWRLLINEKYQIKTTLKTNSNYQLKQYSILIKNVTSTAILDRNSFNKTLLTKSNHYFNNKIIKPGLFIENITQKIKEKQIKGSCNKQKRNKWQFLKWWLTYSYGDNITKCESFIEINKRITSLEIFYTKLVKFKIWTDLQAIIPTEYQCSTIWK